MTQVVDTEQSAPARTPRAWLVMVAGILIGSAAVLGITALGLLLLAPNRPADAMPAPLFVEETASAGIDHSYDGDFTFFVGGGVAVLDCNDDRLPDLYLGGGNSPAGLYENVSTIGEDLRFAKSPSTATDMTDVTGAYPLDIDSDGMVDLAVLRLGENVVLRGTGGCRFERANELWNIDGGADWTVAFSATWESGQALPTMAFGNYVADPEGARSGCAPNQLLRPSGGSTYAPPEPLEPGWCTLSALFSDWDRSGRRDLRFTNDRHYYVDGHEQLWRVEPGETTHQYTEEDGWTELQIWGMGIASHDLTGDGFPEIFLTSQGDNKLQTLGSGGDSPTYDDIGLERGVTAHRPFVGDTVRPSTAWHAEFQDVNNDTFMDLFVTKGNVDAMAEFATEDPNNLLLGRADGSFVESAGEAGIVDFARSRGAAVTDLNLDGQLDLVVVERRENVKLWRNTGPAGSWIGISLNQPGVNPDAIGSWVQVRVGDQVTEREVVVGGGHAGGQLGPVHFGLGTADTADVRVQWPDGETGDWMTVEGGTAVAIDRVDG